MLSLSYYGLRVPSSGVPSPQETYGEDTYLNGVLAAAFVGGLQGESDRYLLTNAGCKQIHSILNFIYRIQYM